MLVLIVSFLALRHYFLVNFCESWTTFCIYHLIPVLQPDYVEIAKYCNIWRNYADIQDSWDSVRGIIEFYGKDKGFFSDVAGPGNFNDPDMVKYMFSLCGMKVHCIHLNFCRNLLVVFIRNGDLILTIFLNLFFYTIHFFKHLHN